jgi:hypothetical protein
MAASYGIGMLSLRQGDLPRALLLLEQAVGILSGRRPLGSVPPDGCGLGAAKAKVSPEAGRKRRVRLGFHTCRESLEQYLLHWARR